MIFFSGSMRKRSQNVPQFSFSTRPIPLAHQQPSSQPGEKTPILSFFPFLTQKQCVRWEGRAMAVKHADARVGSGQVARDLRTSADVHCAQVRSLTIAWRICTHKSYFLIYLVVDPCQVSQLCLVQTTSASDTEPWWEDLFFLFLSRSNSLSDLVPFKLNYTFLTSKILTYFSVSNHCCINHLIIRYFITYLR
jgi:hypothetical protein